MDFNNISADNAGKRNRLVGVRFPLLPYTKLIQELEESGEPGLLPDLVNYLSRCKYGEESALKDCINTLLSRIRLDQLMEFDVWFRAAFTHWWRDQAIWLKLNPGDLSKYTQSDDWGVLCLASMHSNGRVREAALKLLSHRRNLVVLAVILIRVNDWVEPVRELAIRIVKAWIQPDYSHRIIQCLPVILRLEQCKRIPQQWLIDAIGELLTRSESQEALQSGLESPQRSVRRACMRFASAAKVPSLQKILYAALDDKDLMIRFWAATQLLAVRNLDCQQDIFRRLESDPFMPIRREALRSIIQNGLPDVYTKLENALLDQHASMRELARFHLKDRMDVAGFYRNSFHSTSGLRLVAAIRGFGECGNKSGADTLLPLLSSSEVRIRKAVISALGRLDAVQFKDAILRCLSNESPGVSAEAHKALQSITTHMDIEQVGSLLLVSPKPFVRKNALKLICRYSKWEQLRFILAACRDPSEQVALAACSAVSAWLGKYNRSYIAPSARQLLDSSNELKQTVEFLDTNTARELTSLLEQLQK